MPLLDCLVFSSSLPSFSTSLFPSVLFSSCLVGETRTTSCSFLQAGLNSWTHLILLRPVSWVAVIIDMSLYPTLWFDSVYVGSARLETGIRCFLPLFFTPNYLLSCVCLSVYVPPPVEARRCWSPGARITGVMSCLMSGLCKNNVCSWSCLLSLSLHLILWHRSFTGPVACLFG